MVNGPSAFLCGLAVIATLAPRSHAPLLLKWLERWVRGEFERDMLDTFSRVLYFMLLLFATRLAQDIIGS